jgi:hypothetical protein
MSEMAVERSEQRVSVLSGMMSPDTMERRHHEIERLRVEVDHLKKIVCK